MKFYGIADCHGIEAFKPIIPNIQGSWVTSGMDSHQKDMALMALRAQANLQRHAVVFLVEVSVEVAEEIEDLLAEGEYAEALLVLKEKSDSISLGRTPGAEKSWRMIPNPDLDPMSS